ncbi:aldehyde dehydrogenase, partial [Reticulomyxa filosa]
IEQDSTGCHQMNDAINYTYRMPLGVCGLITPWNLPLYLLTWKIAPAIACGNTVVCKPSELTPMTANLLCTVVQKVKLPKGVINIVHGFGKDAGTALLRHFFFFFFKKKKKEGPPYQKKKKKILVITKVHTS